MPEFILDMGSPQGARAYRSLSSFAQGYVQAMFFTDSEPGTHTLDSDESPADFPNAWNPEVHSSLPGDVSFACLAPETLAKIIADCEAFQTSARALLDEACELEPGSPGFRYGREALTDERLGMLFWYARNGHGVSFTDDGDAPCLEALQTAAQSFREVDSSIGDDGLIYLD